MSTNSIEVRQSAAGGQVGDLRVAYISSVQDAGSHGSIPVADIIRNL
jgi:hypothetical protein